MEGRHRRTDYLGQPAEVARFCQAQSGGRESLNALVEKYDGVVHDDVHRQVLGDLAPRESAVGRTNRSVARDPAL
jgi:hypothetical protein